MALKKGERRLILTGEWSRVWKTPKHFPPEAWIVGQSGKGILSVSISKRDACSSIETKYVKRIATGIYLASWWPGDNEYDVTEYWIFTVSAGLDHENGFRSMLAKGPVKP